MVREGALGLVKPVSTRGTRAPGTVRSLTATCEWLGLDRRYSELDQEIVAFVDQQI